MHGRDGSTIRGSGVPVITILIGTGAGIGGGIRGIITAGITIIMTTMSTDRMRTTEAITGMLRAAALLRRVRVIPGRTARGHLRAAIAAAVPQYATPRRPLRVARRAPSVALLRRTADRA